jgi:hyperosmotically inducible protein
VYVFSYGTVLAMTIQVSLMRVHRRIPSGGFAMTQKWNAKKLAWVVPFALSAGLSASAANTHTTTTSTTKDVKNAAPDNTKKNARDTHEGVVTAQDQTKGSDADVEVTRHIRQDLVNDASLSTNAKNVKIITLGGVVTLRGPVASSTEKEKIATAAKNATGVKKVDNQLEIKAE